MKRLTELMPLNPCDRNGILPRLRLQVSAAPLVVSSYVIVRCPCRLGGFLWLVRWTSNTPSDSPLSFGRSLVVRDEFKVDLDNFQ